MKQIIIILILIITLLTSCDDSETEQLKTQINELKNENAELKKAVKKKQFEKFTSSYFMTTSTNDYLTVDNEEKLKISLVTLDTIPVFNVYSNENNKRKLIMENLNTTEFYYLFTPKSIDDNKIDLTVELELSSGMIAFPIFKKFDVREK